VIFVSCFWRLQTSFLVEFAYSYLVFRLALSCCIYSMHVFVIVVIRKVSCIMDILDRWLVSLSESSAVG
jgi:hypothetical protein